jgi:aminoglycoside phosphotransferase
MRQTEAMDVPRQISVFVRDWHRELVWQSAPDALTWRMTGSSGQHRYLKCRPSAAAVPLRDEAARMRWARAAGLPAPQVLAACISGQTEWLLTEGLSGRDATSEELRADPAELVPLLASGLRQIHATPTADCPFSNRIDQALGIARQRVTSGLVGPADLHEEFSHLTHAAALAELDRLRPGTEDLVVCHGDYCLPNVMITGGKVSGFLDLGELCVADRWRDLAVATWSVTWNLGPGFEDLFLNSYGIARDERAQAFYRLLYDLES